MPRAGHYSTPFVLGMPASVGSSATAARSARMTVHIEARPLGNAHHTIEAVFKAFARALRGAVALDPTETGIPSTKGVL